MFMKESTFSVDAVNETGRPLSSRRSDKLLLSHKYALRDPAASGDRWNCFTV